MGKQQIILRDVTFDDLQLTYQWINDADVRQASFTQHPVSWDEHKKWFSSKIKDPNHRYLLAILNNVPVGQVRFKINKDEAIISVLVEKSYRGSGIGTEIISLGSKEIFKNNAILIIHAYVKEENIASFRSFIKAGYIDIGIEDVEGIKAHHLIFKKVFKLL